MDILEAIKKRHCFRGKFKNQPLDKDTVRQIVQAGLEAPSGCNNQTTRFIIVDDPQKIAEMKKTQEGNLAYQTVQAYIAIIIDKEPKPVYHDMSFQVEDAAVAVENILLAATSFGYASVWLDGWLRLTGVSESISKILAIPEDKQLRILLPLGIPDGEISVPQKMAFEECVSYNTY